MALAEKTLGPGHPTVASILHNLGALARATGDHAAAQAYFERALTIDQSVHGPRHPDVARHLNELGTVLIELKQPAIAREHLARALDIANEFYGEEHARTKLLRDSLKTIT